MSPDRPSASRASLLRAGVAVGRRPYFGPGAPRNPRIGERLPPMRQLTSLDAQFLALESARQTGHVRGLAIRDPAPAPGGKMDGTDSQRRREERLPGLPPFRWKLAEVPFGLDFPYWIEDP